MTIEAPKTNHPDRHRPTEMVRAVIGWVVENERRFRAAQNMVDNAHTRF